jgi:hypothetical protein
MENEKKPKWKTGVTILKGKQSVSLLETYQVELQPRLQPDEAAQHKANVTELEARHSGQSETITAQKSKTLGQNEAIGDLRQTVVNVRSIVKSSDASGEIAKAYGVGEKINGIVSSVTAAANMVIAAYGSYGEWSTGAGILESDIAEIETLKQELEEANDIQETSKFTRKSGTMSKNVLQRTVEDEITKISALGNFVFAKSNPAVAVLFKELIPG